MGYIRAYLANCLLFASVRIPSGRYFHFFRTRERVVRKKVVWWPHLDCVLSMEPYHSNSRAANGEKIVKETPIVAVTEFYDTRGRLQREAGTSVLA